MKKCRLRYCRGSWPSMAMKWRVSKSTFRLRPASRRTRPSCETRCSRTIKKAAPAGPVQPVQYWLSVVHVWPELSEIALLFLRVSGSSAIIERTFSTMSSVDSIHSTHMAARTLVTRCILTFQRDSVCGHFPTKLVRRVRRKEKRERAPVQGQEAQEAPSETDGHHLIHKVNPLVPQVQMRPQLPRDRN